MSVAGSSPSGESMPTGQLSLCHLAHPRLGSTSVQPDSPVSQLVASDNSDHGHWILVVSTAQAKIIACIAGH